MTETTMTETTKTTMTMTMTMKTTMNDDDNDVNKRRRFNNQSARERRDERGVDMTREGRQAHRFINQLAQEKGSRCEERDTIDAMQLKYI